MFKRTLESTTSTKICTCIPGGLNCNSDQRFKVFTQKPPEQHNGYVFLFFATTRIKHQQKQLKPNVFVFCNNKNQTSTEAIETHVFVLLQQQESNINQSN